jgi:hypothetical protein
MNKHCFQNIKAGDIICFGSLNYKATTDYLHGWHPDYFGHAIGTVDSQPLHVWHEGTVVITGNSAPFILKIIKRKS